MKKILILTVVTLLAVSVNAQYYIGGSIGFGSATSKPEIGEKSTASSFIIAPEFGYNITNKVDIGVALSFENSKRDVNGTDVKSNEWGVSPYVRYNLIQFGNLNVLGKAALFAGGGKDGEQKYTGFGLNISPMLTYTLSDKFDLFTGLNFLGLGFEQVKYKDAYTNTGFGLNVNSNNAINTGDVTIGFVYKF